MIDLIFEKSHFPGPVICTCQIKPCLNKAEPLANAGIETLPVITAVVINQVSRTFEIVAERCSFLANFF